MDGTTPIASLILTPQAIAERLTAARARTDWVPGDTPESARQGNGTLIPAAVLIPLVQQERGLTVLLTQRTAHLNDHAGQISFPGGRVEPGDATPEMTALREAEEEVGLPRERVRILGRLADYHTVTGFAVTPVVGYIVPPFSLHPDPFEVAEVFEVPLEFLMNPENHQRHTSSYRGRQRSYYAMPYEGRFIWGATAGMIVNLYRALMA